MIVAGGVEAVLEIEGVFVYLFRCAARQKSFALLGDHVGDEAFLGLEVVAHGLRLVFGTLVVEHRGTLDIADTVGRTHGIDGAFGHIHLYAVGVEFYTAVCNLALSVDIGFALPDQNHGVLGHDVHNVVQIGLYSRDASSCRLGCYGCVAADTVAVK